LYIGIEWHRGGCIEIRRLLHEKIGVCILRVEISFNWYITEENTESVARGHTVYAKDSKAERNGMK
jgi:hypothetical protein